MTKETYEKKEMNQSKYEDKIIKGYCLEQKLYDYEIEVRLTEVPFLNQTTPDIKTTLHRCEYLDEHDCQYQQNCPLVRTFSK